MAWRYIQRDFQSGDVLDPEDWNENVREYIEEINGFIDRDNIPTASIEVGLEVQSEVFNEISFSNLGTPQILNKDTQSFQRINLSTNLAASSDELLIVEASLQFDTADPTQTYNGSNYDDGYVLASLGTFRDWIRYDFRMTIDGFEVAYAGPFTAFHKRQPVYMIGCLPVEAGALVVECFVRLFHDKRGTTTETWSASAQGLSPQVAGTLMVNRRKR